jgi:hypothetical protein
VTLYLRGTEISRRYCTFFDTNVKGSDERDLCFLSRSVQNPNCRALEPGRGERTLFDIRMIGFGVVFYKGTVVLELCPQVQRIWNWLDAVDCLGLPLSQVADNGSGASVVLFRSRTS